MQIIPIQYKIGKPESEKNADVYCPAQAKLVNVFFCVEKCGHYCLFSLGSLLCGWTEADGPMEEEALKYPRITGSLRRDTC